jgi:flagellar biosynthesis/type III secretory pathway chaperone
MINEVWTDNLIKVLEYEHKLFGQLLEIADKKTGVVVKGEIETLQELVGKEQKLVNELGKLSEARDKIVGQISKGLGKKPEELILTDLAAVLPAEQANRFSAIRDKLKAVVDKLQSKNDLNQRLLKNALDYVDFTLNLLTQPGPQSAQYGRKGNETGSPGRRILDIKY